MAIVAPIGVFDIMPTLSSHDELWRASSIWNYVESVARAVAHDYGFHEIRTPIFEYAELFQKSVGDVTDIVSKEMYVFEDRGGRKLALRPEGTAAVMRALVEHKFFSPLHDVRLFYIGPMFRYERPQSGRFRQHHQFGLEVVGISSYEQDAELIETFYSLYQRLRIPQLTVHINSLGSEGAREEFRKAFMQYLAPYKERLSEESQRRFERNPLRILDSKDPEDQQLLQNAPSVLEFLNPDDRVHFDGVLRTLNNLNVPYVIEPKLVRGLDYYQKTVFEITTSALGAHNTIGAGGRYDGLLHRMGGPDLPAIGCATGLERIIKTMLKLHSSEEALYQKKELVDLLIIPMGEAAMQYSMKMCQSLRSFGIRCLVDMTGKKLKAAIPQAVQSGIRAIIVLGDNEIQSGKASLKWLVSSQEEIISLEVGQTLLRRLGKDISASSNS